MADPGEFRNLAGEADHAQKQAEMRDLVLHDWDGAAIDAEVRRSQNERDLIRALEGRSRSE